MKERCRKAPRHNTRHGGNTAWPAGERFAVTRGAAGTLRHGKMARAREAAAARHGTNHNKPCPAEPHQFPAIAMTRSAAWPVACVVPPFFCAGIVASGACIVPQTKKEVCFV